MLINYISFSYNHTFSLAWQLLIIAFLRVVNGIRECLCIYSLVLVLLLVNFIYETANVNRVLKGFRAILVIGNGGMVRVHNVGIVLLLAVVV